MLCGAAYLGAWVGASWEEAAFQAEAECRDQVSAYGIQLNMKMSVRERERERVNILQVGRENGDANRLTTLVNHVLRLQLQPVYIVRLHRILVLAACVVGLTHRRLKVRGQRGTEERWER